MPTPEKQAALSSSRLPQCYAPEVSCRCWWLRADSLVATSLPRSAIQILNAKSKVPRKLRDVTFERSFVLRLLHIGWAIRFDLIDPATPEEALGRLSHPTRSKKSYLLSAGLFDLLRNGDWRHRYFSRSEVDMALALAAVNAGLTYSWLWKALCDPKNRGGEKVRELISKKGEGVARRYLCRTVERAKSYAASRPLFRNAEEAKVALHFIKAAVERFLWKGRAGSTDRAVLGAHLAIAMRRGAFTHGASVREVAEPAGIQSTSTVSESQRRLVASGWLVRLEKAVAGRPARWEVILRRIPHTHPHTPKGGRSECSDDFVGPAADVWRWSGLGKVKWLVWKMLDGQRKGCLAERRETSIRAIEQHLAVLKTYGLARQDECGRWFKGERSLEQVARELGVEGEALRQRERHRRTAYLPHPGGSMPSRKNTVKHRQGFDRYRCWARLLNDPEYRATPGTQLVLTAFFSQ